MPPPIIIIIIIIIVILEIVIIVIVIIAIMHVDIWMYTCLAVSDVYGTKLDVKRRKRKYRTSSRLHYTL